jgi:Cd2+/Zn2+-exporting ATPase
VQRRLDVNCLMLVAVAGALALGDYVESAAVVVVFVLAEFVEGDCLRRVRNSLREVGKSDADEKYATTPDGSRVETQKLQVGDVVCCRAGERVGVDGVVTKHFDQGVDKNLLMIARISFLSFF